MNKFGNFCWGLACLLGAFHAGASDVVTLLFIEHPVYHTEKNHPGDVEGLIATPVKKAFDRAGIRYQWQEIPVARQYQIIENSHEIACVVGALENAEREKVGKFTRPIYQGRPIVAVARADNEAISSGHKLEATLHDSRLTLLAKIGYSFGKFVDESVAKYHPRTEITSSELPNMATMLLYKRADYFFMSEDAFEGLLAGAGYRPEQFKLIHFSDMPAGNFRHLWCTNSTPDSLIQRLDIEFDKLFTKA